MTILELPLSDCHSCIHVIFQIVESTNSAANAIKQMEINVKEPLIVPFGVNHDITA